MSNDSAYTRTSANYDQVVKAYDKLGHVKEKIIAPNIAKTKSRDLSIYMQTEALRNVLNDNYRLEIEEQLAKEEEERRQMKRKGRSLQRRSL